MTKDKLIEAILTKMKEKGDFPSLSASVSEILNALDNSEKSSVDTIVSHVVSDFALSQKVLRLANSAMYGSMSGQVTTLTRAVMLLGLDTVTYLAMGLKLLDSFDTIVAKDPETKKVLAQATLAANVARQLASKSRAYDSEECVVLALFAYLGQLVLRLYATDVWESCWAAAGKNLANLDAVLRERYQTDTYDIAQTLAKRWNFPEQLCSNIQPYVPNPDQTKAALNHGQWGQAIAKLSGELAGALTQSGSETDISKILAQYGDSLALDVADIEKAVDKVKDNALLEEVIEAGNGQADKPETILLRALHEAGVLLEQKARPSEMLSLVMEASHLAMGFRRTVFFTLDAVQRKFVVKAGLGQNANSWLNRVSFDMEFAPDVFHLCMARNTAVKIDNVAAVSSRIPEWYRTASPDIQGCLIVPVVVDGKPRALLLGEWGQDAPVLSAGDLDLLMQLKDRFVQTLRP